MQVIVEEHGTGAPKSLSVCSSSKQRLRALFTSDTNWLRLYVQDSGLYSSGKAPFLIQYQGIQSTLQTIDFCRSDKFKWISSLRLQSRVNKEKSFCLTQIILLTAVGCPDPVPHTNAWVRRMGETLVAKCNDTDETWYLTCHNTEWIGEIGNCTEGKKHVFLYWRFDKHLSEVSKYR